MLKAPSRNSKEGGRALGKKDQQQTGFGPTHHSGLHENDYYICLTNGDFKMKQEIKKIKKLPPSAMRQAGLTLIELTIVLLILIGLSGLLLPFVQGFIDKTHDSANSDSLKEVSKILQSYNNLYSGYPENMESLIVGTAGLQPGATATPGQGTPGVGGIFPSMMRPNLYTTHTLAAPEVNQFLNAGISKVATMWEDPGQGNHTLKAVDAVNAAIATGTVLAQLDETKLSFDTAGNPASGGAVCPSSPTPTPGTALTIGTPGTPGTDDAVANKCLEELLGLSAGSIDVANFDYFVMGIGNDSSLIGRVMNEAPIHFAKVGGMNAANKYNHILTVFAVKTGTMANHPYAEFMGTLMPMMKVEGLAQAQASYYAGDGA